MYKINPTVSLCRGKENGLCLLEGRFEMENIYGTMRGFNQRSIGNRELTWETQPVRSAGKKTKELSNP